MDKNRFMKVMVILGIIILPLIYSLFYLKGFWDPYNSLDQVPVAVVNLDKCDSNCKGEKLVKQLEENATLDFKVVSEKEADEGLIDKDYYAVIKIPENFTDALNSAATVDKEKVEIIYSPNTKTNYVASQIIGMAIKQIEKSVQSSITREVVGTLTDNLKEVPNQTQKISDGFGQIQMGAKTLASGSYELKAGINTLNDKYKEFNDGVNSLYDGCAKLYTLYGNFDSSVELIYNKVKYMKDNTEDLNTLATKLGDLKMADDTLNSALSDYQSTVNTSTTDMTAVYAFIINYYENNPSVQSDSNFTNAYNTAKQYTTSSGGYSPIEQIYVKSQTVSYINSQITGGINLLYSKKDSLSSLKSGIDELEAGMLKLRGASSSIYTGIEQLKDNLKLLSESSTSVSEGLEKVNDGANSLSDGTGTLSSGVESAKKEVDSKINGTKEQLESLDGLDEYTSSAVGINEKDYGNVKTYGTFFSPYFMSLSLWVGGILILMGLYYDPDKRFTILGRESENKKMRLLLYNVIGIIQAIILGFVLQLLLDFEITNIFLYYGSCILISEAFLAIIMFLFFVCKDVGKFLAVVFLVLQLAACGGTFPIETEPVLYQALYPFMPMTYSVDLLRESFVNINSQFLIKDTVILLIIFAVFTLLTFINSKIETKKSNKK